MNPAVHDNPFESEQQARERLAGPIFQFMCDGDSYWTVPCKPCNGFHIIALPVRLAPKEAV